MDPASVAYACRACGALIPETEKCAMVAAGRWGHEDPENPHRGFHISALYSLAKANWPELCQEWEKAKDDQLAMRAFVNLRLGETYEETGDAVEAKGLKTRLEAFPRGVIPEPAGVLTAMVDVQPDRLEAQVKAWGPQEESWLVDYRIFHGATNTPEPWDELDAWLLEGWALQDGRRVQADLVLVDSGFSADAVYDFVQPRQSRRIYASKGQQYLDRPGLAKEGSTRKARIRLWHLATDAAKQRVMARLAKASGHGCIHLPTWATEEHLEQLTAEKLVTHQDRRTKRIKREWVKTRTHNEALDLEVGCLCGLFILQELAGRGRFRAVEKAHARWSAPSQSSTRPRRHPCPSR